MAAHCCFACQTAHKIIAQFVHNEWIESYDPTIEDSYRTQIQVDVRSPDLECFLVYLTDLTSGAASCSRDVSRIGCRIISPGTPH